MRWGQKWFNSNYYQHWALRLRWSNRQRWLQNHVRTTLWFFIKLFWVFLLLKCAISNTATENGDLQSEKVCNYIIQSTGWLHSWYAVIAQFFCYYSYPLEVRSPLKEVILIAIKESLDCEWGWALKHTAAASENWWLEAKQTVASNWTI